MLGCSFRHGITAAHSAGQFMTKADRQTPKLKSNLPSFHLRSNKTLFTFPWMNNPGMPALEQLYARGEAQEALHEEAASLARNRFGRNVFVRAVVEISNFCRQNCVYCGMRRDNRQLHRFRAHHEQLADLLIH